MQHGHRSEAAGASPESGLAESSCRSLFHRVREKNATERKQFAASAIGEPPEVANAWESLWQEVLKKAAQKFLASQGHGAWFVVVRVVLPSEGDFRFADGENAVIGNSHAMGIPSQIMQDMVWSAKRWLGVDHPFFSKQGAQECRVVFFIGQR